MKPLKAGQLATLINMEKIKKLKPGQLYTIVNKYTGYRCVIQAKRYPSDDGLICETCMRQNFTPKRYAFKQCPLTHLRLFCHAILDQDIYPKIIKYVKKH